MERGVIQARSHRKSVAEPGTEPSLVAYPQDHPPSHRTFPCPSSFILHLMTSAFSCLRTKWITCKLKTSGMRPDAVKIKCPKDMTISLFIFIVGGKTPSFLFLSLGGISVQINKELVDYQNKYPAKPIYRVQKHEIIPSKLGKVFFM